MHKSGFADFRWASFALCALSVLVFPWAAWIGANEYLLATQSNEPGRLANQVPSEGVEAPAAPPVSTQSPANEATIAGAAIDQELPLPLTAPEAPEEKPTLLKADTVAEVVTNDSIPNHKRIVLNHPLVANLSKSASYAGLHAADTLGRSLARFTSSASQLRTPRAGNSSPDLDEHSNESEVVVAVIRNPVANVAEVHFLVGVVAHSLGPGETQSFGMKDSCIVLFHRGEDFGDARHVLTPGSYEFAVTEQGWKLVALQ